MQKRPLSHKQEQKKIGLLGGSFNPIHYAHLYMAEVVYRECQLDEIWFLPARLPPHKAHQHMAADDHRLAMVEKAIRPVPYFRLCTIEFEREGLSYTTDTVMELQHRHPEYAFFFLIGADMIEHLPHWHQIDRLVHTVTFIGVGRPGGELYPNHSYAQHVHRVDMLPSHLSSTYIRECVRTGKSIRFLVPEDVQEYIDIHRLYQ